VPSFPPLAVNARLRWSVVKPYLDELAPRRILEIGCGQGGFGARLAARAEYLGVEPDATSWEVASSRIEPHGGRVLHGTSDLVASDPTFDLVCAFEVIEHLEDDSASVTDWARRVRPGGALMVSVPAFQERFGSWDRHVGHYRRYSPGDLEATLSKAGLSSVRTTVYGWPLGFLLEQVRNRVADRRVGAEKATMGDRTAQSGRLLQPKELLGVGIEIGCAPFEALQRTHPASGTGAVAVGLKL